MLRPFNIALFALIVALLAAPHLVASSFTFTNLDVPAATIFTAAEGINNSGQIVGSYYGSADFRSHGFLLSGGIFTTIDPPGATFTEADGINNSGQIVGTYQKPVDFSNHGFLLSGGYLHDPRLSWLGSHQGPGDQ